MEHKLKQEVENITNNLIGYSGKDIEYLFEQIIPQYQAGSRTPYGEGKWKIVNRETGEEFKKERVVSTEKVSRAQQEEENLNKELEHTKTKPYGIIMKILFLQIEKLREKGEEEFADQIEARKDLARHYINNF